MTNARKARERRRTAQYRAPSTDRMGAALSAADTAGEHLWIMTAAWRISDPAKAYAAATTSEFDQDNSYLLDGENVIGLAGPGCYKCEAVYSPELAARPCTGTTE